MKVIVTGGGTGIGKGISKALVENGDQVIIVGRRKDVLEQTAKELNVEFRVFDVARDNPVTLFDGLNEVNGLVNNAGVYYQVPVGEWNSENWQNCWDVHVKGPALLSQEFAKHCGNSGAIVNINSTLGKHSEPGAAPYAATKAAQLSLTSSLAQELAGQKIRVNAVLPGVVPTEMTTSPRSADTVPDQMEGFLKQHPLGRLGTPEDVAQAVVWLLHAEWVTGAQLAVDGGQLIQSWDHSE